MRIPAFNSTDLRANILQDMQLAGTPFRGLVVRGEFSLLAYVGVPRSHWLADMVELEFDCHFGVTFRGHGDGGLRPADWYWYGWDYAHYTDRLLPNPRMSDFHGPGSRTRSVEEVVEDLLDVALPLFRALQQAEASTKRGFAPISLSAKTSGG